MGILNDVLDFSKIESGQQTLEQLDFSLPCVVGDAVAMVSQQAHAKRLGVTTQFAPESTQWAVRGDALRLRQIIVNLLGNAVKFTEQGSITLRVEQIVRTDTDALISIVVTDTGIGISSAALDHIFERFSISCLASESPIDSMLGRFTALKSNSLLLLPLHLATLLGKTCG